MPPARAGIAMLFTRLCCSLTGPKLVRQPAAFLEIGTGQKLMRYMVVMSKSSPFTVRLVMLLPAPAALDDIPSHRRPLVFALASSLRRRCSAMFHRFSNEDDSDRTVTAPTYVLYLRDSNLVSPTMDILALNILADGWHALNRASAGTMSAFRLLLLVSEPREQVALLSGGVARDPDYKAGSHVIPLFWRTSLSKTAMIFNRRDSQQ